MPGPVRQIPGQLNQPLFSVHLKSQGRCIVSFPPPAIMICTVEMFQCKNRSCHRRERTAKTRLLLLLSRLFQFSLPLLKLKFHADEESTFPTLSRRNNCRATGRGKKIPLPVSICRMGGGDRMILGTLTSLAPLGHGYVIPAASVWLIPLSSIPHSALPGR